jgi:hypothetical protein
MLKIFIDCSEDVNSCQSIDIKGIDFVCKHIEFHVTRRIY